VSGQRLGGSSEKLARCVFKHVGWFRVGLVVFYEGGAPGIGVGFNFRLHALADRRLEFRLEVRLRRVIGGW
jgi:hypothetical protein